MLSLKPKNIPQWFIDDLSSNNPEDTLNKVKSGYVRMHDKLLFRCPIHGDYEQEVKAHIDFKTNTRVRGCRLCSTKTRITNMVKTKQKDYRFPDWFKNSVSKNNCKEVLDKIESGTLSSEEKILFTCPIHGDYLSSVGSHIKKSTGEDLNHGCPYCSGNKRLSNYSFSEEFKAKVSPNNSMEILEQVNKGSLALDKKILFTCSTHGDYEGWVGSMVKGTGKCPKCAFENRYRTIAEVKAGKRKDFSFPQWFKDEVSPNNSKEILSQVNDGTLLSQARILFRCPIHGDYEQRVNDHIVFSTLQPKCKCQKCAQISIKSSYEDELYQYIISLNSTIQIERNVRGYISDGVHKYELDLYLPLLKLGIEFNGSAFHSSLNKYDMYLKPKDYHQRKFEIAQDKGIHLIQIFDVDWFSNRDKIKQLISSYILPRKRIYARSTEVRRITAQESHLFEDLFHLQGRSNQGSICYGLFYNGDLMSTMSFGKYSRNGSDKYEYELVRYVVKPNTVVVGGARKLFKSFTKDYDPNSVLSYSDCNYFSGSVYPNLGFVFKGYTPPMYYWYLGNQRVDRNRTQVSKLRLQYPELHEAYLRQSDIKSEEDYIMTSLKAFKVYTCGNKRWIWSK